MGRTTIAALCLLALGLSGPGTPIAAGAPTAAGAVPVAVGVPSPGCGRAWAAGADSSGSLVQGGQRRTYLLHVPKGYDPHLPRPLLLNLPGTGMSGLAEAVLSGMSVRADRAGALVVYPDGTQRPQTWNVGLGGSATGVDDVGFLSALVGTLEGALCVDTRRVAATGMSIGAVMDYHLACAGVPWLSAIAPVAGTIPTAQWACGTARTLPLRAFNGVRDPLVPYGGARPFELPIPRVIAAWAAAQGCPAGRQGLRVADVLEWIYAPCRAGAEVDLYTVTDGGHTWPGGVPLPPLGVTTRAIDASSLILSFVQAHPAS